mmetsp:Transcript_27949/g.64506  ORF Transcript_27949/g.64506 Transcript_27949/m.64506 type:complete len:219 (+) Transcript_27949:69-725(+)
MPPAPDGKDEELDLYEILGISSDADTAQIASAFRKAALRCHPDRNPNDPEAAAKFQRLFRAKESLLDPAQRAQIDVHLKDKHELEACLQESEGELAAAEEKLREAETRFQSIRRGGLGGVDTKDEVKRMSARDALRSVQESKKLVVEARYMRDKYQALLEATLRWKRGESDEQDPCQKPEVAYDGFGTGIYQGLCELAMPVVNLFSDPFGLFSVSVRN